MALSITASTTPPRPLPARTLQVAEYSLASSRHPSTVKATAPTDGAPAAIGPYSQAVKTNGMLYVSGCIGIKRELGKLVDGGIGAQTRQVMENMKAIVEAGGSSMDKVVKTTVLMTDISSYPEVNAIYAEFFSSDAPPARAAYAVAALPAGALIEIDCIAIASS